MGGSAGLWSGSSVGSESLHCVGRRVSSSDSVSNRSSVSTRVVQNLPALQRGDDLGGPPGPRLVCWACKARVVEPAAMTQGDCPPPGPDRYLWREAVPTLVVGARAPT